MYFLEGAPVNFKNLMVLGKAAQYHQPISSVAQLKRAYNDYLALFQSPVTLSASEVPEFVEDQEDRHALISLFQQDSVLNDLNQQKVISFSTCDEAKAYDSVKRAMDSIWAFDSGLGQLLNLVVNRVFVGSSRTAGGGSSSGAIGCIWLNPRPNWTHQDYCEFLIHELTHQLVFIDERHWGHYPKIGELEKPENFARSAILNRERPLDKVVHSLIVAFEVLQFRERYFELGQTTYLHPQLSTLQKSIDLTIESLGTIPRRLMSERAWGLIEKVKENGRIRAAV